MSRATITPRRFNRAWFHGLCETVFGKGILPDVQKSRHAYLDPLAAGANVSNILSVTGNEDPWSLLAARSGDKDLFASGFSFVEIPNGTHCSDAFPAEQLVNHPEVIAAQKAIVNKINSWLN